MNINISIANFANIGDVENIAHLVELSSYNKLLC